MQHNFNLKQRNYLHRTRLIPSSCQTNISPKRYSISNVKDRKHELWKTEHRLTSFQKPPLKSVSFLPINTFFCLDCVIYTLFEWFEQLFWCFAQLILGSPDCLNCDTFCDTSPLRCNSMHRQELSNTKMSWGENLSRMYLLQLKIKFRLKLFNLGWF